MALIESLNNINKIGDNYYEVVTGAVSVGAGIDDVSDSTFIMKDGGLLKYTTGCTTTFTRCQFIETETALALGVDNFRSYQPGYPPRFNGTCAPVFKGCNFVCNTSTRSDFDADVNAGMTFTYDEDGSPCRIIVRNEAFAQYNHLASDKQIINGLVIDQDGAGAALEFAAIPSDPTQWSNLKVVNYDGTSTSRHVTMLFYGTAGNEYTISNLECRNLALYGGTGTLRAVDPIGRLLKTNDTTSSDDGRLEVYRTYMSTFIDAVTAENKLGRAVYYTSNGIVSNEWGETCTSELLQYSQDVDTVTVIDEPAYTEVLTSYGYIPQIKTFTIQDETDPLANVKTAYKFTDDSISEFDSDVVRLYPEIDIANKLYDVSKFFASRTNDTNILGYSILTAEGSTLQLLDHNMVVDPTFTFPFGYTSGSGSIAATGTPYLSCFVSGIRLYDNGSTETSFINEADFDGVFAATAEYNLNNFQFSTDGSKVFAFGTASSSDSANVVLEYALASPYDLDTATLTNTLTSGAINGQQGYGRIVDNGTKVIWSKRWGTWYAWDLGTPWDLSTAGARQDIPFVARRTGLDFNHDGTKLFTTSDGSETATLYVYEYNLSTPYDVSTAVVGTTTNLSSIVGASVQSGTLFNTQRSLNWFDGGNYFIYNDPVLNNLFVFKATTAFDSSTLSLFYTLDGGAGWTTNSSSFTGMSCSANNKKLYLSQANVDTGVYNVKSYPLYEQRDFNGEPETIYVKATALNASALFDRIETTGVVTFQNGATTNMTVQDANGVQLYVTVNNLVPGSRIQIFNVTTNTELVNTISATATYSYGYLGGVLNADINTGDEIYIRASFCDGLTAYNWFESIVFASSEGVLSSANQEVLQDYPGLGVNGSTVTEFSLDVGNIEVDLNDPDGISQKRRLVAWLYYIVANTQEGMRDFFGVIDLEDSGNAKINVNIADVKIDNVGLQQVIFTDTDFYLYRSDGTSWVQHPSSGNYGITSDSGKVYVAETGISGLTSEESAKLDTFATKSDVIMAQFIN